MRSCPSAVVHVAEPGSPFCQLPSRAFVSKRRKSVEWRTSGKGDVDPPKVPGQGWREAPSLSRRLGGS
eukprot:9926590-Alexandrium_andersonii.AAC.1